MPTTTDPQNGQNATDARVSALLYTLAGKVSFVETGFTCTNGGGLVLEIAAGTLTTLGYRCEKVASQLALTDAATNRVWIRPDLNNLDTVLQEKTTDDTPPGTGAVKIAEVVTAAGAISTITDKRPLYYSTSFKDPSTSAKARLTLYGLDRLGVGPVDFTPAQALHVQGEGGNAASFMVGHAEASGQAAVMYGRKARGTIAAPALVNNDDEYVRLQGQAYDGTAYQDVGYIAILANGGTHVSGQRPGSRVAVFANNPNGAPGEVARFTQDDMRVFRGFLVDADLDHPFKVKKSTVSVTAPGAGYGLHRWEAGTNAGTLKLVLYAGTSTTGHVLMDNVGAGN